MKIYGGGGRWQFQKVEKSAEEAMGVGEKGEGRGGERRGAGFLGTKLHNGGFRA
jgi:hypothetical protein